MGNINKESLIRRVEKLLNEDIVNQLKEKQEISKDSNGWKLYATYNPSKNVREISAYFNTFDEHISLNIYYNLTDKLKIEGNIYKLYGTESEWSFDIDKFPFDINDIDLLPIESSEDFPEKDFNELIEALNILVGEELNTDFNESNLIRRAEKLLNESEKQMYNVEYRYTDGAPGLAIGHVKVRANSEEEALEKAEEYASNTHYRDDSYYIQDSCKIVTSGYSNDPIIESSQKNEYNKQLHLDLEDTDFTETCKLVEEGIQHLIDENTSKEYLDNLYDFKKQLDKIKQMKHSKKRLFRVFDLLSIIANKIDLDYDQYATEYINRVKNLFKRTFKRRHESLNEAEGIYDPRTILKAYNIEKAWIEKMGHTVGGVTQVLLFIINDYKQILDTHAVDKKDIYTYQPKENEYYLDMVRDSGDVITDYNLEPAQKLVDRWNDSKKRESINEEYKSGDKVTIDGKQGIIDSTFIFEDGSILGAWVKLDNRIKYYTIDELNNKSNKNESVTYHFSVEDIGISGNNWVFPEEAYKEAKSRLGKLGYKVSDLTDDLEFTVIGDSTGVAYDGVIYSKEDANESVSEENLDEIYKVLDYYMTKLGFNLVEDRKPYFMNKKYIKADNTNYIHYIDFTPQMDNDHLKYEVRDEKGHQKLCNTYNILDAVDMDTSLQLIEFDMEGLE